MDDEGTETPPAHTYETLQSGDIVVRRIGKYMLLGRIGIGATGEVWLGHHPELNIPVAVKILSADHLRQNPDYLHRFLREAQTAAQINHPSLVRVFDAGVEKGEYFMVMEYVAGGTLHRLLAERGGPLPVDEAIAIVGRIARALQAASDHAIIHRDVKPSNIMLDGQGQAKLSDLGFAKQLRASSNTTQMGTSMGTPAYMAPEQIRDSRNVDVRSDLYSLGATFYHMVTGQAPYPGPSAVELLEQHMRGEVPEARRINPEVPEAVSAIIRKLMAKAPADRYQSVAALLLDLERVRHGRGSYGQRLKAALRAAGTAFGEHLTPAQRLVFFGLVAALLTVIVILGAWVAILLWPR